MRKWTNQEVELIQKSKAKQLIDLSKSLINTNTHHAILLAKMAWDIQASPDAKQALSSALYSCFDEESIIPLSTKTKL